MAVSPERWLSSFEKNVLQPLEAMVVVAVSTGHYNFCKNVLILKLNDSQALLLNEKVSSRKIYSVMCLFYIFQLVATTKRKSHGTLRNENSCKPFWERIFLWRTKVNLMVKMCFENINHPCVDNDE